MHVRDWMTSDPETVSPDTTVAESPQILKEKGFRHLPVVDSGRLIGIVSDRDVAINAEALRAARHRGAVEDLLVDDRPVEAIMSMEPHVIDVDATVGQAARLLLSRHFSALPVVDAPRSRRGRSAGCEDQADHFVIVDEHDTGDLVSVWCGLTHGVRTSLHVIVRLPARAITYAG